MPVRKSSAVADRIRARIHDGSLREGDLVPSTRALAAELGVSRGTVVAAYEQLDGEGYLRAAPGAGTRVLAAPAAAPATREPSGPDAVSGAAAVEVPAFRIDLSPGVPNVRAISERDWRSAWRHAAAQPFENRFSPAAGTPELRRAVAAQLSVSRGVDATADDVVITSGTSETLSLVGEALRVRLGRAPRIAVEDPGYRTGQRALISAGASVVAVPTVEGGLDVAGLRRLHEAEPVDAVMVTPSHQYPLGGSLPVARRLDLVEWAASARAVVVEDDYDSEFRHRGDPLPALASLDRAGVVVHVGSFSKTFDPRLRCGYLILPRVEAVRQALLDARTARGPAVGEPVQHAVAQLLTSGAYRRHLGRARRDYTHRRDLIAARAARPDVRAAGVDVRALEGGLHAVVSWAATGPSAASVLAALAAQGIRAQDLTVYRLTPSPSSRPALVVGYAPVPTPALLEALAALRALLAAPPLAPARTSHFRQAGERSDAPPSNSR
ncbi:PLP-dependent aminotransferase family protein [Frondihabitans australicus]|uniref:GntR family transcriptional regulator/MocR family aminotransferase n=1 Tax=Frondihabitans australicus TaxID=386892 RepID=A0A495ICE8_9MICO|nr:PLP-dependent aminotransferase family protein [Frondihabitans australicus]RKR73148.1 GntR family transcriptional regulator/MocR family aminotransferase [Frondihabitans australicus]